MQEIVCILDKSGSMRSIKSDAIGGFNSFLDDQKKLGDVNFTLVLFDTIVTNVYVSEPINNVQHLDDASFAPGGMTSLYDAIGSTFDMLGKEFSKTKPEKVIVAVLTDGEENSSSDYTLKNVREMITHQQEKYGWEIIYLGANQDSFAEGQNLNINAKDISNYAATGEGIRGAFGNMTASVKNYRGSNNV